MVSASAIGPKAAMGMAGTPPLDLALPVACSPLRVRAFELAEGYQPPLCTTMVASLWYHPLDLGNERDSAWARARWRGGARGEGWERHPKDRGPPHCALQTQFH